MAQRMQPCVFVSIVLASIVCSHARSPALYVFGDSLNDVGNNNYLPNAPKTNFPFSGIDYPGGVPTGRWSNGLIAVDYLATYMLLQRSPPPYLSLTSDGIPTQGVNFASAGSGILNITSSVTISLPQQVTYFLDLRRRLTPRERLAIPRSLFYFNTGSNDILVRYATIGPQNTTSDDAFIATLVASFRTELMRLYKKGARKIGVLGSSTFGCIPFLRSISPSGDCIEYLNDFSLRFKNATRVMLANLSLSLPGLGYSFVDNYELISYITANAAQFGITNTKDACCGSGRFNAQALCTPNSTLCSDRRSYSNWDASHPTQIVAKLITDLSFFGSRFTTPRNIQQLVRP